MIHRYVVIEHKAKRAGLHYDLRFELVQNCWASFAMFKSPLDMPEDTKRLAIRLRAHTEAQAVFVGVINDGYGAGDLCMLVQGECSYVRTSRSGFKLWFFDDVMRGEYRLHPFLAKKENRYLFVRYSKEIPQQGREPVRVLR